jgi:DNA primase
VPLIAPESVEAVRQAADLVDLVRGQVQLSRRGGRWQGRCPFHEERTPSFGLIPPDNSRYYCFGCGATGDAFTWLREREGVGSFAEAVESLAERFGVPLRYERASPGEEAERLAAERRSTLLERAAAFYATCLWRAEEAAPARDYLLGRGFGEEVLRRYRIGYAPGRGAVLAGRAVREGFSREELAAAGLARLRDGVAQDFFAARVIFPIADGRGRVLGFGARTLDAGAGPKYVNSPETAAFQKRKLLFGLHEARAAAAAAGWTVVCEGYTDVLAFAEAGVAPAVACMGTSLTVEQLRTLARTAPEVRLSFDADEAGQAAAWRTVEAASGVPVRLAAVTLPDGGDPGDLAASPEGQSTLRRVVDDPKALVGCLIRARVARAGGSASERERALSEIAELLRRVPDSVEKDEEGVRVAATTLGLSRAMEERLRDAARHRGPSVVPDGARRELSKDERRERRLLSLAVALPQESGRYLEQVPPEAFRSEPLRRAFTLLSEGRPPAAWPPELAGLAVELEAEAAALPASEEELREAVYRVQLPGLERRAEELRAAGDERERLRVLGLAHRVRAALRGEP